MTIVALVLVGLAALVHYFIFYMESVAWTGERTRKTFGMSQEEAEQTKAMAFNQGFYNLFLAVEVTVGIILFSAGLIGAGAALIFAGAGSMALAAAVLVLSDRSKASAAAKQGLLPLLGVIALGIGLA